MIKNKQPKEVTHFHFERSIGKISFIEDDKLLLNNRISNLKIDDNRICDAELLINTFKLYLNIKFSQSKINILSDSYIDLNGNTCFFTYDYDHNDRDFISLILKAAFSQHSIISLLPNPKIKGLENFKSVGQIEILIRFAFLLSNPSSYNFRIDFGYNTFSITNPGFSCKFITSEFQYYPKNEITKLGIRVRNNYDYINSRAAKIIQFLEDPKFWAHDGFDISSIGKAMAFNLHHKKFLKGASTISMQLIKNLFLDSQKTIMRKYEELILTIMMEKYFKIPKKRILEIYLQIIEFGPAIYGLHNAAKFYFNKELNLLSLMEVLVLCYIIPRPKYFLEAVLINSKQLDKNLSKYIELNFLGAGRIYGHRNIGPISNKIKFKDEIGIFHLSKLEIKNIEEKLLLLHPKI